MLDIIMPHYNEPWTAGEKFFSMLDLQRDADFSKIRVLLIHDGGEPFPQEMFMSKPYRVEQLSIPHGGVSAARNAGLDASDAEWVMFCDFDDMFSTVYALRDILNVLPAPDYDALWMDFYSEDTMRSGEMRLHTRGRNLVFIHGKLYRRRFLMLNGLRFDPTLEFNEDSCFNAIADCYMEPGRTGKIETQCPPYVWCYRPGSATTTPGNNGKALLGLYNRNKRVCEAFRRRMPFERYCAMVARTVWDTYYSVNVAEPSPEQLAIRADFRDWYANRQGCCQMVDDDTMAKVQAISQAEHERGDEEAEARWAEERPSRFRADVSLAQWLEEVMKGKELKNGYADYKPETC